MLKTPMALFEHGHLGGEGLARQCESGFSLPELGNVTAHRDKAVFTTEADSGRREQEGKIPVPRSKRHRQIMEVLMLLQKTDAALALFGIRPQPELHRRAAN